MMTATAAAAAAAAAIAADADKVVETFHVVVRNQCSNQSAISWSDLLWMEIRWTSWPHFALALHARCSEAQ